MSDTNELFDALASRGTPRGADVVLDAALRNALADDRGDGRSGNRDTRRDGDLDVLAPVGQDAPPPAVNLDDTVMHRTRRPWRTALTAGGLAAMLGVVSLGIASLVGNGGSDSPEGAVRQLAEAINHEDPLAAVDVLAPNEVRTLRDSVDAASRKAAEIELVESAGAPFAGLDLGVEDLSLDTTELPLGFAKVTVQAGLVSAGGDRAQLSEMLQRSVSEIEQGSVDLGTQLDLATQNGVIEPFIMVLERDGRWYVSPVYTALEYLRVANGLPEPELGSGRATAASLGADSPELAARAAVDAVAAGDWIKLLSLAPPDELPVYDYRVALTQLLNETVQPEFTVAAFDAQVDVLGDRAVVEVRASGGFDESSTWELRDGCLMTTQPSSYYEGDTEVQTPYTSGICLSSDGMLPFDFFGGARDDAPVRVMTVQRDGRWYVSPVGTALDALDRWIASVDRNDIAALLGDLGSIEPEGSLTLGQELTVDGNSATAYTFEGSAGQQIVGQVSATADAPFEGGASVVILGPDGQIVDDGWDVAYGVPATLPVDGTYRAVVQAYWSDAVSVTLWDAAHAPDGVLDPSGYGYDGESCQRANGVVTCAASESGFAPAPLGDESHDTVTTLPPTSLP